MLAIMSLARGIEPSRAYKCWGSRSFDGVSASVVLAVQSFPTSLHKMEAPARRPYTWKTVLIIIAVSWGSTAYGYAGSIIATTLGQPSFIKYMGLDTAPNAAALIGTMNGLFYTGGFIGTAFIGKLSDRYGRKFSLTLGTAIILVSNALLAGSVNVPMFIVFRFFQGLGYVLPPSPSLQQPTKSMRKRSFQLLIHIFSRQSIHRIDHSSSVDYRDCTSQGSRNVE